MRTERKIPRLESVTAAACRSVLWLVIPIAASCVSYSAGRTWDASRVAEIQHCATTENELRSWFGAPLQEGISDGYRSLEWYSLRGSASMGSAGSHDRKHLLVFVDRSGKVISYHFNPPGQVLEVHDRCGGKTGSDRAERRRLDLASDAAGAVIPYGSQRGAPRSLRRASG
jgi:hypothetical protein